MSQHSPRVVFVCTGNSCRSQMAEGLARVLGGGRVESFSAGTHPRPVHPLAVQVMAEIGIDIGNQRSKTMDALAGERFDFAITVCDRARQQCPAIPGAPQQIHWGFDDPAEVNGSRGRSVAGIPPGARRAASAHPPVPARQRARGHGA